MADLTDWFDTANTGDRVLATTWNTIRRDVQMVGPISSNVRSLMDDYISSGGTKWTDLTDGGSTTLHSHASAGSGNHYTANYIIWKDGNDYYARNGSDGSLVDSNSSVTTVLNAVSADISADGAATISFEGDTTYTFADGETVKFTDKLVYIDGNFAEFNIDACDCTIFSWYNDTFTPGHMHGGIKNIHLDGDRTKTNQIFANFSGTCAYINDLHTRNHSGRAPYNVIRLNNTATHSVIRDCFIRAARPIRLMGAAGVGGEASRVVIDHCHLGDTIGYPAIIGVEQQYGQNVSIINNQFTQCEICYSGGVDGISDLRIQNNCFAGLSSNAVILYDVARAVITDNIFKLGCSDTTYIKMQENIYGGIISDNIFSANEDLITAIKIENIRRLSIEDNQFMIGGTQSGCKFIYQEDTTGYANQWVIANNNIASPNEQTGTCMIFEDLRNSWIHDNIISVKDPDAESYDGNIGFSVADYQIDSERNIICDRYISTNSAHTAVMGEDIVAYSDGGAITVTLPTYHTYTGKRTGITIKNMGSNLVTLEGAGSDTIDGTLRYGLGNQYDCTTLESAGPTTWYKTSLVSGQ